MDGRRASHQFRSRLKEIERDIIADPTRALRAVNALRKSAEAAGEPEAFCLYCDVLAGRCMQRRGLYNEALKAISASTRRLDALGAGREAATGYHYLSQINSGRNDMQSALECCLRGQELARRARDWYLQMNLVIDMGPIYRSFGDADEAINAYRRGLEIYHKHVKGRDARIAGQEAYTEFIIALNIAIQYYNARDFDKAKRYLDNIAGEETRVLGGAYIDLYNLEYARVCFGAGLVEEGVTRTDVVMERLEGDAQRSLHGVARNYLGLSDDLIGCGELERCHRLLELVRPSIERDDNPSINGILSMVLARFYKEKGDMDTAIRHYDDYVDYVEKSEMRDTEETKQSVLRRVELQQRLQRRQKADAARARQIDALRQEMAYRAEREEILQNISENTDTFFLLFNPSAQSVDFVSQNSRRLFGFDVSAAGNPVERITQWLGIPEAEARKLLSGEVDRRVSADYAAQNPSTGAPMTIHQELIPTVGGAYIMVLTDVTRIMETQASLETAIEVARQASEAKTRFLSNMSHDIRTPLNAVVGLLEMLEDGADDPALVRDCAAKMRHSSRHLLALINDLLDMSRIEAGRMTLAEEAFTMPEFLESLMALVRPQSLARGQTLTLDAKGIGGETLIGDPLHMRQAFLNILGNAVKFTPQGGSITLRAREFDAEPGSVAYEFIIIDTGCGMSEEFLTRIFNPFERAEGAGRTAEGSGLGMAITKSIVDMMNGDIQVRSAPGEGTTFTVRLRIARKVGEAAAEAAPKPEQRATLRRAQRGAVLLVEDNPLNLEIVRYMVEKLGYQTLSAKDGLQALECVQAAEPGEIALVLMDIRMPGIDGYEATRRIRALERADAAQIPIIAMTADAFEEDVRRAINSGMNAHIAKPLDSDLLANMLARYMP